jgi:hypothetical protein
MADDQEEIDARKEAERRAEQEREEAERRAREQRAATEAARRDDRYHHNVRGYGELRDWMDETR